MKRGKAPTARQKKCQQCKVKFKPFNSMQKACSPQCANKLAKAIRVKAEKADLSEKKKALKKKGDYRKEAQQAFNAFIRARDKGRPCISCGVEMSTRANQVDAGHYRSVGSCPELRFEPVNCHAQCKRCNRFSFDTIAYRNELIGRIGADVVGWLEGPHKAKKYTVEQLEGVKKFYRWLKREIDRGTYERIG